MKSRSGPYPAAYRMNYADEQYKKWRTRSIGLLNGMLYELNETKTLLDEETDLTELVSLYGSFKAVMKKIEQCADRVDGMYGVDAVPRPIPSFGNQKSAEELLRDEDMKQIVEKNKEIEAFRNRANQPMGVVERTQALPRPPALDGSRSFYCPCSSSPQSTPCPDCHVEGIAETIKAEPTVIHNPTRQAIADNWQKPPTWGQQEQDYAKSLMHLQVQKTQREIINAELDEKYSWERLNPKAKTEFEDLSDKSC